MLGTYILVRFYWKLNFLERFSTIFKYQISWKSVQWESSFSMRTDRRRDRTKLIVAFRSFVKAPTKVAIPYHDGVCVSSHFRFWPTSANFMPLITNPTPCFFQFPQTRHNKKNVVNTVAGGTTDEMLANTDGVLVINMKTKSITPVNDYVFNLYKMASVSPVLVNKMNTQNLSIMWPGNSGFSLCH